MLTDGDGPSPYCTHTARDLTSMRLPTHGVFDNISLKSLGGMGFQKGLLKLLLVVKQKEYFDVYLP